MTINNKILILSISELPLPKEDFIFIIDLSSESELCKTLNSQKFKEFLALSGVLIVSLHVHGYFENKENLNFMLRFRNSNTVTFFNFCHILKPFLVSQNCIFFNWICYGIYTQLLLEFLPIDSYVITFSDALSSVSIDRIIYDQIQKGYFYLVLGFFYLLTSYRFQFKLITISKKLSDNTLKIRFYYPQTLDGVSWYQKNSIFYCYFYQKNDLTEKTNKDLDLYLNRYPVVNVKSLKDYLEWYENQVNGPLFKGFLTCNTFTDLNLLFTNYHQTIYLNFHYIYTFSSSFWYIDYKSAGFEEPLNYMPKTEPLSELFVEELINQMIAKDFPELILLLNLGELVKRN